MKQISRNALWNLAGNGLPLLVGLATIPPLLRGLGTERFGLLTLVWATLGYFSLFDLGIGRATTKYVAEYEAAGRVIDAARLLRAALFMLGLIGILAAMVLAGLAERFSGLLTLSADLPRAELDDTLRVMALTVPVMLLTSSLRGALEGQERFRLVNLIKLPANVAMFVIPALMLWLTQRLELITLGLAGSRVVAMLLYLWWVRGLLGATPAGWGKEDWRHVRRLSSYGGWIFLAFGLGSLMSMGYIDRLLIGSLRAVADIAYYATPMEIVLRALVVPGAIVAALFPVLSGGMLSDEELCGLCGRIQRIIALLILPLVILMVALGHDLLRVWIDVEFANRGTPVLQLLMLGLLFNALAHVPYTFLQATGRPKVTALRHVVELPFYLPLLWWLVLVWGVVGAALTWAIWALLDMLLLFWLAHRVARRVIVMPGMRGLLGILVTALLAYCVSRLPGFGWQLGGVAILLAVFVVVAWRVVPDSKEREILTNMLRMARMAKADDQRK